MEANPDRIIEHKVRGWCDCGVNLECVETVSIQRRQEIELPAKLIEVIEHQIEINQCGCGKVHQGVCELKGNVQYGSKFKTLMVYLNQYQFTPFERLQELSEDIFGVRVSDGLLENSNKLCYEQLEQTEWQIKNMLLQSAIIA
jgi:transposase